MKSLPMALMLLFAAPTTAFAEERGAPPDESLSGIIAGLDTAVFDAFNRCEDPAQLEKHARHFARDVEFYHDNGGVTWNRKTMLANTRKYACGHYTRELIPGTLAVYPIKDFGAISQGSHRFCQRSNGACEGTADFTMVWRRTGDAWTITRVLSYGHRAAKVEP